MADKKEATRPWGRWAVIEEGAGYKIKRVEVLPGHRLSLQKHRHRSEHWTVVAGKAQVSLKGRKYWLKTNESMVVPQAALHRLANRGKRLLVLIEVQVGDYLGEDDIVRLEDDYGRTSSKEATKR